MYEVFDFIEVTKILDFTKVSQKILDFREITKYMTISSSHVWMWEFGLYRKLSNEELMLLNCDVEEDSWESFGLQGDPTSPS